MCCHTDVHKLGLQCLVLNINTMTSPAIQKIRAILSRLSKQARELDGENEKNKAHYLLKEQALFSELLFSTHSDKFLPYVNETEKRTRELEKLIASNRNEFAQNLLVKIEQQISALLNGLNANKSMHEEAAFRSQAIKSIKAKKYKKAVSTVLQPTQDLYQKLSETHEFERRLLEMIAIREQQRAVASSTKSQQLSQEILALHQRLGRCRQAIVKIERQIAMAEKRH